MWLVRIIFRMLKIVINFCMNFRNQMNLRTSWKRTWKKKSKDVTLIIPVLSTEKYTPNFQTEVIGYGK